MPEEEYGLGVSLILRHVVIELFGLGLIKTEKRPARKVVGASE